MWDLSSAVNKVDLYCVAGNQITMFAHTGLTRVRNAFGFGQTPIESEPCSKTMTIPITGIGVTSRILMRCFGKGTHTNAGGA